MAPNIPNKQISGKCNSNELQEKIRASEHIFRMYQEEIGSDTLFPWPSSPHFSPWGEMIAQGFGFTADFLKKRNTDCIPD